MRKKSAARSIDVASYDALRSHVEELETHLPDGRLCFRGQVHDYPHIVSAMARRVASSEFSFRETFYNSMLWNSVAQVIAKEHLPSVLIDDPSILASARAAMVEGILQHYGFRTHFVDVTSNLDVALCFGHFQYLDMFPVFDGDSERPKVRRVSWYERARGPHGYLYVLDCQKWHPRHGQPNHGQAIDLTNLVRPGWNRVQMQQASVVHSDVRKPNLGDLRPQVQAVYRFPIPLPGAESALNETRMWFPRPKDDPIYRTLLNSRFVEFTYLADHPVQAWRRDITDQDAVHIQVEFPEFTPIKLMTRGLDVPEYQGHPESIDDIKLYRGYDQVLTPTFYFPWLKQHAKSIAFKGTPLTQAVIKNVLRSALVLVNIPFGHLSRSMKTPPSELYTPRKDQRNIFFEFSPYNYAGPYADDRAIRAVWISGTGRQFSVAVFGAEQTPWAGEPAVFTWSGGSYESATQPASDIIRPYFWLALALLRDMAEGRVEILPLSDGSKERQIRYPHYALGTIGGPPAEEE